MVGLVHTLFAIGQAIGPEASSEIGGWWARRIGRLLPQHRIALANARGAFPEKSDAEIRAQGRHRSAKVLPRYAKRTMKQVEAGAKKRRAVRTKADNLSE